MARRVAYRLNGVSLMGVGVDALMGEEGGPCWLNNIEDTISTGASELERSIRY